MMTAFLRIRLVFRWPVKRDQTCQPLIPVLWVYKVNCFPWDIVGWLCPFWDDLEGMGDLSRVLVLPSYTLHLFYTISTYVSPLGGSTADVR